MNTTDLPVVLESGQPIAVSRPTIERDSVRKGPQAFVNNISLNGQDEKEFTAVLDEFNINPDLSPSERQQMLEVPFQNRHAFAYGSRKLGQTNLVKMTLDTGDAPPISSPRYHASPN